ncbi:MAG: hypothetical protein IPF73_07795 [Betaproteobacteria bacterium]|nr:hypothetical protein [Betaproteobacteria bacterium]
MLPLNVQARGVDDAKTTGLPDAPPVALKATGGLPSVWFAIASNVMFWTRAVAVCANGLAVDGRKLPSPP